MTPSYFNVQPSHQFLVDLNEDQAIPQEDDDQHQLSLKLHHHHAPSSSSSTSPSYPLSFSSSQDQAPGFFFLGSHHSSTTHQEMDNFGLYGDGSVSNDQKVEMGNIDINGLRFSIWKKEEQSEDGSSSVKWMSSKMRLMKKMMIKPDHSNSGAETPMTAKSSLNHEDQKQPAAMENNNNSSSSSSNPIRVCADCNTTKTPLWRSGPRGPKSLCNACGIRQRKARRAMAAAAANGNVLGTSSSIMKSSKGSKSNSGFGLQQKKRSKIAANSTTPDRRKICFEEFALDLTQKLSLHQVFPQEEKEAAILLMALSYGLVHG